MQNLREVYNLNSKYILGSDNKFINNIREQLLNNFILDYKVNKNNESIKFTDPKILKNINFKTNQEKLNYTNTKNDKPDISIEVKNGVDYGLTNVESNKITFQTIDSNLDLLINKIESTKQQFTEDYIVNLNSILLNSGFRLTLNENENSKILLSHNNDKIDNTIFAKNFFHIKKNSQLVLIEKFINDIPSNSNVINFFEIEEGGELIHLVIQNNVSESYLQYTSHTNCHENSIFNQTIFNCSEISCRNHHYAVLQGAKSEANLSGIFFGARNQIIDNKTEISHLNHNCVSNQIYKGILTDNAKASYLSKTFVDQRAQKTDGYQLSKGILLSDDAYFHSKPELRIFADDVKCSHGSTIGPFDQDIIYYLRSRGINEKKAKSLLINSFCNDLLSFVKDKNFVDETNKLLENWLFKYVN